jgi:two-component system sensor histidine kinase KdpD
MKSRPDPDQLLQQIQAEEHGRGNLKIFLGYAAGVGKTFAMLEAAHQRKREAVDLVVGYIETHKRAETEAMLAGLELVPRASLEYRGIKLSEMDVDAILARHPSLVLVDEMAHTNAPGARHAKRYQDIEEILDAGIDVYTTLNIQHLESLNDVVAQVTGVIVRETVPDRVIDEAAEIEVIDLPPDELLLRLKEGKVYIPDQAARAIQEFFRKGNLTALREMSLRRAAERVDGQMRSYMRTESIPGVWPAAERLLVCISPSPYAEKIVRTGRRLADELNADWFVVYVEVATRPELKPANRARIDQMLLLAESLGAKARTIAGHSIQEAVFTYARKHNITKIVVGKPLRSHWREWLFGSVVQDLIYASGDIDVYVISAQAEAAQPSVPQGWRPHRPLSRYAASLGLVGLATLLGLLFRGQIEPTNLVMIYLATVVLSAVYLGRGPSLLAAVAGVLAFDYFLVPPYLTFAVGDTQYVLTFIVLLAIGLVVSTLTAQVREQAEAAIQREARAAALYSLGRDLTSAKDLEQVGNTIIDHIGEVFSRQVAIFLPKNGQVSTFVHSPDYVPDANELAVANWVFQHDQPAGRGTDTLPEASVRCHPLRTSRGPVGVLGVRPPESGSVLTMEQRQSLLAFADQAALSIERAGLAEQAKQADLLAAADKLQTALLNSISHDLRTPLVSITGALTSLDEQSGLLNEDQSRSLVLTARDEAERLNRLVGNLLSMTRIESGAIRLNREPGDIQDVIGTALEQLGRRAEGRQIQVQMPPAVPLVPMDFTLIVQVVVNLVENAVKYSPEACPIDVSVSVLDHSIRLEVADRGVGIPPEDLARVFDKFYRVQRPESVSGTGLGLSISKGIIEAHRGRIYARGREGGGSVLAVELPLEDSEDSLHD